MKFPECSQTHLQTIHFTIRTSSTNSGVALCARFCSRQNDLLFLLFVVNSGFPKQHPKIQPWHQPPPLQDSTQRCNRMTKHLPYSNQKQDPNIPPWHQASRRLKVKYPTVINSYRYLGEKKKQYVSPITVVPWDLSLPLLLGRVLTGCCSSGKADDPPKGYVFCQWCRIFKKGWKQLKHWEPWHHEPSSPIMGYAMFHIISML